MQIIADFASREVCAWGRAAVRSLFFVLGNEVDVKILEKDLPLFPLHTVLFPQARLPLQIFEPRYVEMIGRCVKEDMAFGVLLIKEGPEVGGVAVPHSIGTIARIMDVARLNDGRMNIIVAGVTRFKLQETSNHLAYLTGNIEIWRDENVDIRKAEPVARRAARAFDEYTRAIQAIAATEEQEQEADEKGFDAPKDPTLLAWLLAANLHVSNSDRQSLLEAPTTIARLKREILFMEREVKLLSLVSDQTKRVLDQGTFSLN